MSIVTCALLLNGISYCGNAVARHHVSHDATKNTENKIVAEPTGPLLLIVSVAKQHVSIYGNDGLVARASVSTGKPGHSTPRGIFTILEKERFHRSNLYSDAPMPFMQRITWSGVALHAGVIPHYPASHGCVRLPASFAKWLYGLTEGGERVVITRQDIEPVTFSHMRLPIPKFQRLANSNIASGSMQTLENAVAVTNADRLPMKSPIAKIDMPIKSEADQKVEANNNKDLNPIEYAKAMRSESVSKVVAAASVVKERRSIVIAGNKQAGLVKVQFRKANAMLHNAIERVQRLDRKLERVKSENAQHEIASAKLAADAMVKEAQSWVERIAATKAQQEARIDEARKAFKQANETYQALNDTSNMWKRRISPVSIFISRKTGRLYVRQAHTKLFDVPITIKDNDQPIGTHLYLAMQPEADGNRLRWLSLTIPEPNEDQGERNNKRRHRRDQEDETPKLDRVADHGVNQVTASAALDRIDIPQDVSNKVSELLWTGASLTVSDRAMSDEVDDSTDFIVLTR